jgi:hypothetical protein
VSGQDELEAIFGPSIPYVLELEKIFFGKEQIFERHDKHKKEKEIENPGDHIEMNLKSDRDPRMIKKKGTSRKIRKNTTSLVKDYKDDFVQDEFKSCGKDVIQHIIPIKKYAKPFREKIRKLKYKIFPMAQRKLHQMRFREHLIRWLSWIKVRRKAFSQNLRDQGKIRKVFNNSSQPVGRQKVKSASERATP